MPLTYMYVEDDINSYETLTPAHSLSLNQIFGLTACKQDSSADADYDPQATSADRLLAMWVKGLNHIDNVWRVWR